MAIADLLLSQHRWGRTRCRRFLAAIPLTETKTVGSLTDRQRRALVAHLNGDLDTVDSFALSGWGYPPRAGPPAVRPIPRAMRTDRRR